MRILPIHFECSSHSNKIITQIHSFVESCGIFVVKMKWSTVIILIFMPMRYCKSLNYFSTYENLITGVSSFFSERFSTQCVIVLQPENRNWEEDREIFRITKYLFGITSTVLTTSFQLYEKYARHYHGKRSCPKMMVMVLGWQENSELKLSEFSHKVSMSEFKWLIFLLNNMTTSDFLKNVDTPFNSEIITAKFRENKVELEEGFRVAEDFPLRVVKYGIWTAKNFVGISTPNDYLYRRRKDMEGFPVRASTRNDFPISLLKRMKYSGEFVIEGYFGSVYYELGRKLNYTPVYVPAVENATGVQENGEWNGLLGMIQRNEIDFAVGPVSFLKEVNNIAGVVRPLLRSSYQIFFKQHGTVIEWSDILKPFQKYVWLSVIIWIIIATFTLSQLYHLECGYGQENPCYQMEYNKMNSFLTFLKALCQQGNPFVPQSNSCRVLFITGYYASTILLTAYSAALISNLTTQAPRRPFDSLETFLGDGTYELIAIQKSTDYSYFTDANDTLRRNIFEKLMKHIPEERLPTDKEGGIDEVCENKKRALFITFAVTQLTADIASTEKGCPVLHFRTPLDTVFLSIARRKNFPYSSLIDYRLQNMAEYGILSRLQKTQWPLKRIRNEVKFKQVTLEQVVQIHFIWIIGTFIAILFLISEIYFHDSSYRHNCGVMCSRQILCDIEKFIEKNSKTIKIGQNIAFWFVAIIIVIFIIYVF